MTTNTKEIKVDKTAAKQEAERGPIEVELDQATRAKKRAALCNEQIQDALLAHGCRIVPMLTSEPVGTGPGTRMLVGATYGVIPDPED